MSSHKCQVSNKSHSAISSTILGTAIVKKASSFSLDKCDTFKYTAFYDKILRGVEPKSIQIKYKTMKQ